MAKKIVLPCKECLACEEKGFCPTDDDMKNEIYSLLWKLTSSLQQRPFFFTTPPPNSRPSLTGAKPSGLENINSNWKIPAGNGDAVFLLAVGAARGKNLFDGVQLTIKYFLDAIGASFEGSLSYRQIENKGDMEKHPTVLKDVKEAVNGLLKPFVGRKKITVRQSGKRLSQSDGIRICTVCCRG